MLVKNGRILPMIGNERLVSLSQPAHPVSTTYLRERDVAPVGQRCDDEAARVADELERIDELGVADAHDALLLGRPKVAHLQTRT